MNLVIRRTETMQVAADEVSADLAERVSDVLGNMSDVQSFARIEEEARALRRLTDRLLDAQFPVLTWWAPASVATRSSATLALLTIFLTGVRLDIRGLTTIGEIATFTGLATMLIGRLEQIVGFVNFLFGQAPKLAQFFDAPDTASSVVDRRGAAKVGRLAGHVRFESVSFSYGGRRDAVADISFDASGGQTIALVGATGSGKSTTLALLHRVYDPARGRVTIDGRDIRDMTLRSPRDNIGVVFQEPFIFARSIEENLRIGKPDATPAEIALALALDAGAERQLQDALNAATRGGAAFVIAHRLATVRKAGRILAFDKGEIVEAGSFEALVAQGGVFAALAKAQFMDRVREPGERRASVPLTRNA